MDLVDSSFAKRDGRDKGIAETHINQPRPFHVDFEKHVIELRAKAAILAAHPRGEHLDAEAERCQQLAKQSIELIAETATAPHNNLLEQQRDVEGYGAVQRNVEVFEWNGEQMLPMQSRGESQAMEAAAQSSLSGRGTRRHSCLHRQLVLQPACLQELGLRGQVEYKILQHQALAGGIRPQRQVSSRNAADRAG